MFGNMSFPFHAFLLNAPFSLSTDMPNNIWMEEMTELERRINRPKAIKQWFALYNFIASQALTYILPSKPGLQDQVYVANLGIVLPHLQNTVVVSTYCSEPRHGETEPGVSFFKELGFDVYISPKYFEGEADLKYLKNNTYVGAHGIRTSKNTLGWLESKFDMKVIPLEMKEPYLYHLDCILFPLSVDAVMLCTDMVDKPCIAQIEKHVRIIDVPEQHAFNGITNSLRLGKTILCSSNIEELKVTDDLYTEEREKIEFLEKVCANEGFEPVFFNLSEYTKSGAMLSCCVMHLNYLDYLQSNISSKKDIPHITQVKITESSEDLA